MKLFDERQMKKVMDEHNFFSLKWVMTCPNSELLSQVKNMRKHGEKKYQVILTPGFLHTECRLRLLKTTKGPKAYVKSECTSAARLIRVMEGEHSGHAPGVMVSIVHRRTQIVSALAMTALFERTRLKVYDGKQAEDKCLLSVPFGSIRTWLESRMTFTGDIERDFSKAWMECWFNMPMDIHPEDTRIKEWSLTHFASLSK